MAGNTYAVQILNADGTYQTRSGEITYTSAVAQPLNNVNSITSGALPTVTLSSGTGAQISATASATTYTPITYDNSASDATLKVELSPDNSTYSTLATTTWKTFTNAVSGNIHMLGLVVPAGWYVKLTGTHATIGATTYF